MFSPAKVIATDTPSLRARVAAKIRVDEATGCHCWTGACAATRRGCRPVIQLARRKSRVVRVARLVLEWAAGPPPTDLHEAGHTCPKGENEICVNPEHLRWMTRDENEAHKRTYQRPQSHAEDERDKIKDDMRDEYRSEEVA